MNNNSVPIQPKITQLTAKLLIGISCNMSVSNNKTAELWGNFGPRIKEIANRVTTDKISLQIYDANYHRGFNPSTIFKKWAAVEVHKGTKTPEGMKTLELEKGLYAVFHYKGSSADTGIFQYIFGVWLPQSEYQIDNRPHFEVLGSKYRNNDSNSEEEIWIPVVKK